jgi:hypothetical protein
MSRDGSQTEEVIEILEATTSEDRCGFAVLEKRVTLFKEIKRLRQQVQELEAENAQLKLPTMEEAEIAFQNAEPLDLSTEELDRLEKAALLGALDKTKQDLGLYKAIAADQAVRLSHLRTAEADDIDHSGCICVECGHRYTMDVLVDDALWDNIKTATGGLLCPVCIVKRIGRLGFSSYSLVNTDDIVRLRADNAQLQAVIDEMSKFIYNFATHKEEVDGHAKEHK